MCTAHARFPSTEARQNAIGMHVRLRTWARSIDLTLSTNDRGRLSPVEAFLGAAAARDRVPAMSALGAEGRDSMWRR